MPVYKRTNDNQGRVQPTGGDYYKASGVVKDILHIVTAAEETSRVIATGFRYDQGLNSLEVFLNGQLLRCKETIQGTDYGDYEETSNFTVTFETGVVHAGDQVRFRVTANSYDKSNDNNANLNQLAKSFYGRDVTTGLLKNNGMTLGAGLVNVYSYATEQVPGYGYCHEGTIEDALADIGSDQKTLYFPNGLWLIDNDLTIPENVNLKIEDGCIFEISSGVTLTINTFECGVYQCFSGDGSVVFTGNVTVIPQWFGKIGTANDTDVVNKAIAAAGNYGIICFIGKYYFTSGLTMGYCQTWYGRSIIKGGGPVTFSLLSFNLSIGNAIYTSSYATIKDLMVVNVKKLGIGIYVDGTLNSSITLKNVTIRGFDNPVYITNSWYSYIQDCSLCYCNGAGLTANYCYALVLERVLFTDSAACVVLSKGATVNLIGCTLEAYTFIGVSVGPDCYARLYGCYFESYNDNAIGVHCGNYARVHMEGTHTYVKKEGERFISGDGSIGVHLTSRNNKIMYVESANTEANVIYYLPDSGHVDISGDNWKYFGTLSPGVNVKYVDGVTLPKQFYNIEYPWNYTLDTPVKYVGFDQINYLEEKKLYKQGIHLTNANSGSSGIVVNDVDNLDVGTKSFTLVWEGALPNWKSGIRHVSLVSKIGGEGSYAMGIVQTTGVLYYVHQETGQPGKLVGTTLAPSLNNFCPAHITCVVKRETDSIAGSITFYVNGRYFESFTIDAATPEDLDNTGPFMIAGDHESLNGYRNESDNHFVAVYNRALLDTEVLDLYKNGINYLDKWGAITPYYTSDFSSDADGWLAWQGTATGGIDPLGGLDTTWLRYYADANADVHICYTSHPGAGVILQAGGWYRVTGKIYIANSGGSTYLSGVRVLGVGNSTIYTDITTVGSTQTFEIDIKVSSASASTYNPQIQFAAMKGGSLNFVGANNSANDVFFTKDITVQKLGSTIAFESEGVQPAPGQWLDSSSYNTNALQPAAGSSIIKRKSDFEIKYTNTWTASDAAQNICDRDQAILPPNCYIESIVGVIAGVDIEDITIGDGNVADYWVTITSGLTAGTTSFTLATNISDGSNYKMVVDPDAECTMTISWTIKGYILQ